MYFQGSLPSFIFDTKKWVVMPQSLVSGRVKILVLNLAKKLNAQSFQSQKTTIQKIQKIKILSILYLFFSS